MLTAPGTGLAAGAAGGAAIAWAAYGGATMLATASTGTAISTLSGAAATNATLAWFGGGSLAAGGFGIAGGTLVLGSLVALPALGVAAWFMENAGEKALNTAESNLEKVKTFAEDANLTIKKLQVIEEVTQMARKVLCELDFGLCKAIGQLRETLDTQGENHAAFDRAGKESVFRAVTFASIAKAMMDTPILDADGNLVLSSQKAKALQGVAHDPQALMEVLASKH